MHIGLICVGRLKAGPEREIYARYAERIESLRRIGLEGLDLREIDESKAKNPAERKAREGEHILASRTGESGARGFRRARAVRR